MVALRVVLLTCMTACLRDNLVECADGRLCPVATVCDLEHATCVTPAQTTACATLADGDLCNAGGIAGICDLGTCVSGCGDGVRDASEDCDDGNFASHDGCSSGCLLELPSWSEWQSPWRGRITHVAAFHAGTEKLIVLHGDDGAVLLDEHWHRDRNGNWSERALSKPPPRRGAVLAYDSVRDTLVLFGGADSVGQPLADTWEFDGASWNPRAPTVSPPPALNAAMAFDPLRGRSVLFDPAGQTWEYDGIRWRRMQPLASPPPRYSATMAWDPSRQRIVLFGGSQVFFVFGDTWEYNGVTWSEIAQSGPGGRTGASLTWFPARNRLVLFGGAGTAASPSGDVWELGPAGWSQLATSGGPYGRNRATVTHDPIANVLVVVGGGTGSEAPWSDVWELAPNATWRQRSPQLSPSARMTELAYDKARREIVLLSGIGAGFPDDSWSFRRGRWINHGPPATFERFGHALAYDADRERVVAVGGRLLVPFLAETSQVDEWDGSTWTVLPTTNPPPPRSMVGLVYDEETRRMVMFGGSQGDVALDETWELVGTTWERIDSSPRPAATTHPIIAYDPVGARTVLVAPDGATWSYANRTWTPLATTGQPPPRQRAQLVFDDVRNRLVMYGGYDSVEFFDDVWELVDTTWTRIEVFGTRPPLRNELGFIADRSARSLVLFGGTAAGTTFADTWLLQHRSATPDEDCANSVDDDGDRQVDALDPDCN